MDDKASAGEELRIFGKNFGEKTRAWIVGGNGSVTELPMLKAENYALLCRVPETLGR